MSKQVEQYSVVADAATGEWIGEPEYVGQVELTDWGKRSDTDAVHFDTYEVPTDDGVSTITRAIEVVWQSELAGPNPHQWVEQFGGPKITWHSVFGNRVANSDLEGWWYFDRCEGISPIPLRLHNEIEDGLVIGVISPTEEGDALLCDLSFSSRVEEVKSYDRATFKANLISFWDAVEIVKSWQPRRMQIDGLMFWCHEQFGSNSYTASANGVRYCIDRRESGWSWEHTIQVPDSVKAWAEISGEYLCTRSICDDGPFDTPEQAARLAIQSARDVAHKIKLAMEPEDPFSLDDEDPLSASTPFEHVKALHSASQSSYSRGYLAAALAVRQQLQASGLEAV